MGALLTNDEGGVGVEVGVVLGSSVDGLAPTLGPKVGTLVAIPGVKAPTIATARVDTPTIDVGVLLLMLGSFFLKKNYKNKNICHIL